MANHVDYGVVDRGRKSALWQRHNCAVECKKLIGCSSVTGVLVPDRRG